MGNNRNLIERVTCPLSMPQIQHHYQRHMLDSKQSSMIKSESNLQINTTTKRKKDSKCEIHNSSPENNKNAIGSTLR